MLAALARLRDDVKTKRVNIRRCWKKAIWKQPLSEATVR